MEPRTIVITGASDGIGAAAASALSGQGHTLLLVGRSPGKTHAVAERTGGRPYVCDFADLDQVRQLAAQLDADLTRIDVLVNNAGAMTNAFTRTVDGIERTLQVNHLASQLLTTRLLTKLQASGATVITTASNATDKAHLDDDLVDLEHEGDFDPVLAYANSKLENIVFTAELDRRYRATGINAVAFHPGAVASNFAADTTTSWRFIYRSPLRHLVLISAERAAKRLVRLVDGTPGTAWQPGGYYSGTRIAVPTPQAGDTDLARRLWERSEDIIRGAETRRCAESNND